jgi:hypothetical protein
MLVKVENNSPKMRSQSNILLEAENQHSEKLEKLQFQLEQLTRDGDVHRLIELINANSKNPEFFSLLDNEMTFLHLYLDVYGKSLEKEEKVFECIRLLIAYGLKRPKVLPEELIEQVPSKKYCQLANRFYNQLTISLCITTVVFKILTSLQLENYLQYLKRNPHFNQVISEGSLMQKLEEYQHFLLRVEREEKEGNLVQFYENLLTGKDVLKTHSDWQGKDASLYPTLSECRCNGHEREIRQELEAEIMKQALNRYPVASTKELTYLSLGSGNLLQDFIIIFKLLKAGYKQISVSLIEPDLSDINKEQFRMICRIAQEVNAVVHVNYYPTVDQFITQTKSSKVHLISAIDFENIFKKEVFDDLMKTKELLDEHGFFLFSFDQYKLGLTKNAMIPLLKEERQFISAIFQAIDKEKSLHKQHLNLAMLGQKALFMQWIYLLPALKQYEFETLTILLPAPEKRSYFNQPTGEVNKGFTEENLSQFLSLCLPGKKISVKFINDPGALDQDIRRRVDIVTWLGVQESNIEQLYQQMELVKQQFHNASSYISADFIYANQFIETPIVVAQGKEATWLPKSEVLERMQKMNSLSLELDKIVSKINELKTSLTKQWNIPFFNETSKQTERVTQAIGRAMEYLGHYLATTTVVDPNFVQGLVTNKVKGQESIFESFGSQFSLINYQTREQRELADFMQTNYKNLQLPTCN